MKLGQNFGQYFVRFQGNGVSIKNAFWIYGPLVLAQSANCFKGDLSWLVIKLTLYN